MLHATDDIRESVDATLIMLPFGPIRTPSIGLGLLKGVALANDFNVKVRYANVRFAAEIGVARYERIAQGAPSTVDLYGEWLMSHALRPITEDDIGLYLDQVVMCSKFTSKTSKEPRNQLRERMLSDIREIVSKIDKFLFEELEWICARKPPVVGLTSTFQQNSACFAIAKKIKERMPDTLVVFGGANAEGIMGRRIRKEYPCIDEVVSGEGELSFLKILQRKCRPLQPKKLNQISVTDGNAATARSAEIKELDQLPYPDYSEYFMEVARTLDADFKPHLLFETSRGCWWGERSHCTFCGLNGTSMAYRSKTQSRALEELNDLIKRYGEHQVDVVDNILDMDYFGEFIPALSQADFKIALFYETKANLSKRQLRALAAAGIRAIQPGIESLSDGTLKIMRKGIKAMHNIQLLKWSKQIGINAVWNFLWGFPGEDMEELALLARIFPKLHHFAAPQGGSKIRLDRFSPLFEEREKFGLTNVRPFPAYRFVYDLSDEALFDMAYYFDFDYPDARNPDDYTGALSTGLTRWQEAGPSSELLLRDFGDTALVIDTRDGAGLQGAYTLNALQTAILRSLDKAITKNALREDLQAQEFDCAETLDHCIAQLTARGLILELSGLMLALTINLDGYSPQPESTSKIHEILKRDGLPGPDCASLYYKCLS